jgi:predicted branched-subunit amino acid permease
LGLDFAMIVAFIGMLMPLLKSRPVLAAVVVASVVAVLTYTMPNKIGLMIAALAGVAAGVIFEAMSGEHAAPVVTPEET